MRAVTWGVVGVALIATFLLLLSAGIVYRVGMEDTPSSTADVGFQLLQEYDQSFVELWVRGCSSSEPVAFCRCAIEEYTARLQPYEFDTAAAIAQSGGQVAELPENVRAAIRDVERECR